MVSNSKETLQYTIKMNYNKVQFEKKKRFHACFQPLKPDQTYICNLKEFQIHM